MDQVDGFVELADVIGMGGAERSHTAVATVVRTDEEGTVWVHYDGGVVETPVHACMYAVKPGDTVPVTTRKGRSSIDGNATDIPLSSSGGKAINENAIKAISDSAAASSAAASAQSSATSAAESAGLAAQAAKQAQEDADTANDVLDGMKEAAQAAHTTLEGVYADAVQAKAGAESATKSANSALGQLGIVQDVIGVLDWASKHGVFVKTTDTEVDGSKVYFVKDGSDYTPVVDPQQSGLANYYELSMEGPDAERMQEFILAHLAVTQRGLWVLPAGIGNAADEQHAAGYKMLLSSDGAYIYDAQGDLVRSDTAEGTVFAEGKRWYVGGEDGYILYAPPTATSEGGITIGGSNVTIGDGRTLSELLAEVDGTIVFKVTEDYGDDDSDVDLTAHVYQGGADIASQYPDSAFAWYRKDEGGAAPMVPLGNGRTINVLRSSVGYGAAIVCRFTPPNDSVLLDGSDDTLTDSQDNPISARTPSGDYVRVADLTVETTVFDSDRLLVVGSEDEHLVTVGTLKEVFGDGDYERLSNRPSIEDVELIGNKTFPELGIFKTDEQGYSVPDDYTLTTMDINQLWANAQPVG